MPFFESYAVRLPASLCKTIAGCCPRVEDYQAGDYTPDDWAVFALSDTEMYIFADSNCPMGSCTTETMAMVDAPPIPEEQRQQLLEDVAFVCRCFELPFEPEHCTFAFYRGTMPANVYPEPVQHQDLQEKIKLVLIDAKPYVDADLAREIDEHLGTTM